MPDADARCRCQMPIPTYLYFTILHSNNAYNHGIQLLFFSICIILGLGNIYHISSQYFISAKLLVDFFLYRKNTFKCLFEVKHIFLDVGHIGEENHGGWKVDNNTKQTTQHDEIAEV